MKLIIVGHDPGLTSAFAAIDLRGKVLKVKEKREWPTAEMAKSIRKAGKPLIIAVDKKRASEKAEKFAASFGARLWSPEKDLEIGDKKKAVKETVKEERKRKSPSPEIKRSFSSHEKDALAAAVFAYREHASLFSRIDDTLEQVGMKKYGDEIKRMVLTGKAKNIDEALKLIRKKGKREVKKEKKRKKEEPAGEDKKLRKRLKEAERSLDIQKMYIKKLKKERRALERSKKRLQKEQLKKSEKGRKKVLREKEIKLRENMISNLRTQMRELNELNEKLLKEIQKRDELIGMAREGRIPLVPVSEWSKGSLAEADRKYKIKDNVLWIRDFASSNSATKYCIALDPKAVVAECDEITERKLGNASINVVKGVAPRMHRFYGSIKGEDFEGAFRNAVKKGFLGWLKEYRDR